MDMAVAGRRGTAPARTAATAENAGFSSVLDALWWISAAIIFLSHLRALVWLGIDEVENSSIAINAIYAATSMSVEAVAVFFVLSGFLVGFKFLFLLSLWLVGAAAYQIAAPSRGRARLAKLLW